MVRDAMVRDAMVRDAMVRDAMVRDANETFLGDQKVLAARRLLAILY